VQLFQRLAAALLIVLAGTSAYAVTYVVPTDKTLIGKADAIVIGRALRSYVEESKDRGIETVTVFAIEETLKGGGSARARFEVRVPGGVLKNDAGKPARAKLIPGVPQFVDGERLLLFVSRGAEDRYYVTDLALGVFGFATDDLGRSVLIRTETEIHGWNLDGTPHREPRREADRFLRYVRDVAGNRTATEHYTIEPREIVGKGGSITETRMLRQTTLACAGCTAQQYTMTNPGDENGIGFRWKTFPVNWNRGNTASNAGNGGNDAINIAFATWQTGSSVNYVFASTTANTNGIGEANDAVNNIVFEKSLLAAYGVGAYSCASGGVLGIGGVQSAFGDATNTVEGVAYFATAEGDVSMNQGVNACIGGNLSVSNFNSAVTHEFGHTLGFRHSDKSRDGQAACGGAYDCENAAIMTASITGGLNGALQAWDQRAVARIYPGAAAPAAPTNVVATANTAGTSVTITWNAVGGATYKVFRSDNGTTYSQIGTPGINSFTDNTVTAPAAYLYRVRAVSGADSPDSAPDLAAVVALTDPTITPGTTTVKAAHIAELRLAVNALHVLAGLGAVGFTDNALTPTVTAVKTVHLTELRDHLNMARTTLGFAAAGFATDPTITAGATTIKANHITQLRTGVQ
jgi:hypothetical protein